MPVRPDHIQIIKDYNYPNHNNMEENSQDKSAEETPRPITSEKKDIWKP